MKIDNLILLTSMKEIQKQVDVLHTVSIVCLIFAVLLLIAAIVEFFLLDILQIIQIRTGHAARKGIRQLETETSKSGHLREKDGKRGHSLWNTVSPLRKAERRTAIQETFDEGKNVEDRKGFAVIGEENTSLLESTGAEDTSLLENLGNGATTLLEQAPVQYDYSDANITLPLEEEVPVKIGRFIITKNIMMIHTDEVI